MSVDISVPVLGESISEATIARWLKKKGEAVKLNEPLVELETDKVTVEVNASVAGILDEIIFEEGANVGVGTPIGRIVAGDAQVASNISVIDSDRLVSSPTREPSVPLSPSVRKLVADNGIDPKTLEGTGKDGRLTKGDVLNFVAVRSSPAAEPREERVRMTRLRKRIAERLKDAQNTAAMLTTFNEVDMSAASEMRSLYNEAFEKKHGVKLGFMSFFVKAVTAALKLVPAVNAEISEDYIIYKNYYDIGVAVGTEQGLVVPVIRDADTLSFAAVEKKIGELAKRARDGKLAIEELVGGTFTVTNGGIYGSLNSTPILNPPQSGILGMHKIQKRPVVVSEKGTDRIEIRPMMYVALSYDHRIIDGREAVTFLIRVKEAIECPERLLIDL